MTHALSKRLLRLLCGGLLGLTFCYVANIKGMGPGGAILRPDWASQLIDGYNKQPGLFTPEKVTDYKIYQNLLAQAEKITTELGKPNPILGNIKTYLEKMQGTSKGGLLGWGATKNREAEIWDKISVLAKIVTVPAGNKSFSTFYKELIAGKGVDAYLGLSMETPMASCIQAIDPTYIAFQTDIDPIITANTVAAFIDTTKKSIKLLENFVKAEQAIKTIEGLLATVKPNPNDVLTAMNSYTTQFKAALLAINVYWKMLTVPLQTQLKSNFTATTTDYNNKLTAAKTISGIVAANLRRELYLAADIVCALADVTNAITNQTIPTTVFDIPKIDPASFITLINAYTIEQNNLVSDQINKFQLVDGPQKLDSLDKEIDAAVDVIRLIGSKKLDTYKDLIRKSVQTSIIYQKQDAILQNTTIPLIKAFYVNMFTDLNTPKVTAAAKAIPLFLSAYGPLTSGFANEQAKNNALIALNQVQSTAIEAIVSSLRLTQLLKAGERPTIKHTGDNKLEQALRQALIRAFETTPSTTADIKAIVNKIYDNTLKVEVERYRQQLGGIKDVKPSLAAEALRTALESISKFDKLYMELLKQKTPVKQTAKKIELKNQLENVKNAINLAVNTALITPSEFDANNINALLVILKQLDTMLKQIPQTDPINYAHALLLITLYDTKMMSLKQAPKDITATLEGARNNINRMISSVSELIDGAKISYDALKKLTEKPVDISQAEIDEIVKNAPKKEISDTKKAEIETKIDDIKKNEKNITWTEEEKKLLEAELKSGTTIVPEPPKTTPTAPTIEPKKTPIIDMNSIEVKLATSLRDIAAQAS